MPAMAEDVSDAFQMYESPGVIRPDRGKGPRGSDAEPVEEPFAAPGDPSLEPAEFPMAARSAIADAPSLVPAIEASGMGPGPGPESGVAGRGRGAGRDEVDNLGGRGRRLQGRRTRARRSSRWTALILVLFAFNVALIGARSEVVRYFPQTASLFSAMGLPVNL